MNVRLGINPLTWSNDDMPWLGADVPLETCLAEAAEAGYAGVELGNKFPRDVATLGPLLARHGLALVSGWYSLRLLERDVDAEWAAMQPHFELLRALGCAVMVCCDRSSPRRASIRWPRDWTRSPCACARTACASRITTTWAP
jgi:inosose dehydratase